MLLTPHTLEHALLFRPSLFHSASSSSSKAHLTPEEAIHVMFCRHETFRGRVWTESEKMTGVTRAGMQLAVEEVSWVCDWGWVGCD